MKTKLIMILCLLPFLFVSCMKNDIKIRPGGQYVPASGGTYNIKVKNAKWIEDYGPGGKLEEKGDYQKGGTVYVVTTDWLEALYYPKLEYMTLNVFENTTGEERGYSIRFTAGNYSASFGIRQGIK